VTRLEKKALFCLLGLLPLLLVFTQWDFVFHQASLPRYFLAVLWSLVVLIFFVQHFRLTQASTALSVYVIWAGISLLWSGASLEQLIAFSHWLVFGVFIVVLMNALKNNNYVNLLLWGLFGSLVISSLIGLYQAFSGQEFIYLQLAPPSASFVNRNFAASASMMLLPFAVWKTVLSKESKSPNLNLLAFLGLLLLLFYIGIVQSRGVLLAIIGFCCLFCLWQRVNCVGMPDFDRKRRIRLLALCIVLVFGWVLSPAQKSLDVLNPDSSISIRYDTWHSSYAAFIEQPMFGHGVGSFRSAAYQSISGDKLREASNEDRQITHAHNEYLEILVELGMIGLAFWLLVIGLLIRQLFKAKELDFKVVSLLALSGVAIHSFFSFPLHNGGTALIAASLFAISQFDEKPLFVANRLRGVKVGMAFSLTLILSGFVFFFFYSSNLARVYQLGGKNINCDKVEAYESSLNSSYWLSDYPSRSVYSQALLICKKPSARSSRFIEELANEDPTFVRGHLMVAEKEFQRGDHQKVKQRMDSLLHTHKELVEPWLMLIKVAHAQGDQQTIDQYLKNAEASGNKSEMINWYRARYQ